MAQEDLIREAMASAICEAAGGKPYSLQIIKEVRADTLPPDAYDENGLGGHYYWRVFLWQADAALAADQLRHLLGTKAVEALLAGEAGVVPLQPTDQMIDASYSRERKEFGVAACGLKHSAIYETLVQSGRLDTPGEAA